MTHNIIERIDKFLNNSLSVRDKVKFVVGSDYVEPKDRDKTFVILKVRGDESQLRGYGYVPSNQLYKVM